MAKKKETVFEDEPVDEPVEEVIEKPVEEKPAPKKKEEPLPEMPTFENLAQLRAWAMSLSIPVRDKMREKISAEVKRLTS